MRRSTLTLSATVFAAGFLALAACSETNPDSLTALGDPDPPGISAAHLPGNSSTGTVVYTAQLSQLNDSAVSGTARIVVRSNRDDVQVTITARGLTPDVLHAQHIHGFLDATQSLCPTLATDDVDGSGLVEVGEGVDGVGQDYGGILVPLDGSLDVAGENGGLGDLNTFPVASSGGSIHYNETMSKGNLALNGGLGFGDLDLDTHAVVLHGAVVGGSFNATLPVACGRLSQKNAN